MNPHRIFAWTTDNDREDNHSRYLVNGVLLTSVSNDRLSLTFHGDTLNFYPIIETGYRRKNITRLWWWMADHDPDSFSKLQEYIKDEPT